MFTFFKISFCCLFVIQFSPLSVSSSVYASELATDSVLKSEKSQVPGLLKDFEPSAIRSVIEDEIPSLNIKTLSMLAIDGDHVVAEINGEWIFRFPGLKEFLPIVSRETLLLRQLQNKISVAIPLYEFVGKRVAFVGYRKIIGDGITEACYRSYSNELRQQTAEAIALFLSQFHCAMTAKEAAFLGYSPYDLPLEAIVKHQNFSSTEVDRIVREALNYAKSYSEKPENQVLLHNDLHGENFTFNLETNKLMGVIDFSDASIGDYSVEFSKLFTIHEDLAIRTSEAYAKLRSMPNPLKPAAAHYILRKANSLIQAQADNDEKRIAKHKQTLVRFVFTWDSLR